MYSRLSGLKASNTVGLHVVAYITGSSATEEIARVAVVTPFKVVQGH